MNNRSFDFIKKAMICIQNYLTYINKINIAIKNAKKTISCAKSTIHLLKDFDNQTNFIHCIDKMNQHIITNQKLITHYFDEIIKAKYQIKIIFQKIIQHDKFLFVSFNNTH